MASELLVRNLQRRLERPARLLHCSSFLCRLRGLTFRPGLGPDAGLLLVQESDSRLEAAIHMLFVPFPLAVFWIDSHLTVVDKVLAKPWRPAYFPARPARYILEIHPDRWQDYQVGDHVEFEYA